MDYEIMTESDVIQAVLDAHNIAGSAYLAQRIQSALIRKRLHGLSKDLEGRIKEGLA